MYNYGTTGPCTSSSSPLDVTDQRLLEVTLPSRSLQIFDAPEFIYHVLRLAEVNLRSKTNGTASDTKPRKPTPRPHLQRYPNPEINCGVSPEKPRHDQVTGCWALAELPLA